MSSRQSDQQSRKPDGRRPTCQVGSGVWKVVVGSQNGDGAWKWRQRLEWDGQRGQKLLKQYKLTSFNGADSCVVELFIVLWLIGRTQIKVANHGQLNTYAIETWVLINNKMRIKYYVVQCKAYNCSVDMTIQCVDLTSHFYFFCYFLYLAVFTQNVCGTEWPFICWCAINKLLNHSIQCVSQWAE